MNFNFKQKIPLENILELNDVHIYCISVDDEDSNLPFYIKNLSDDEMKRANRFVFEKDKKNFIIKRGVQRQILSYYLNVEPQKIIFTYNEYGKPNIDKTLNHQKINFNVSHSNNKIILGIVKNKHIGIDIENITSLKPYDDVINRYFSKYEILKFNSLSNSLRQKAFFATWTRKEAYIKAQGLGLSYPLNKFSVSIDPNSNTQLIDDENCDISTWSLEEILSSDDYIAAIAVKGTNLKYTFKNYNDIHILKFQ